MATVLFDNPWLALRAVDGYVYSHETRCGGRIIAVLPYRVAGGACEYLIKSEITPCWDHVKHVRSSLTGGWEGGDPAGTAVHELEQEAGYTVSRDDLLSLGECYASKSADTVYSLFAVDLTGREQGEATGDGTPLEAVSEAVWVRYADLVWVKDAQLHVMLTRLRACSETGWIRLPGS